VSGCLLLLGTIANSAPAATLSDLLAGGFVDAGNARFSGWQLISLDATGSPQPDLSQVTVVPLVNIATQPGLQFVGNGQLATTGVNALDLVLNYRVQALTGSNSFNGHALSLTGPTFGGSGGLANVSEEAITRNGADLGPNLAAADNQSDVFLLNDEGTFAPQLDIAVNMNVFVTGVSASDTVTLPSFAVRYMQTGPPVIGGDFDQDGDVDGADFLRWQVGQSPNPSSPLDLAQWRTNFGQSTAATMMVSAAPEPTSAVLAGVLALCMVAGGGRRSRRAARLVKTAP
jgi:hypothetical protein